MTTQHITSNGERFTANFMDITGLEHIHRYQLATILSKGKDVLDIACGAGYGSWMIAQDAHRVYGVDASGEVVAHATQRFKHANLTFHQGFCAEIPLTDACVDTVVSFETLEHIFEQDAFLDECRRVLRPDGILIISTPNLEVYNLGRNDRNPFHVKELSRTELETALKRVFTTVAIGTQGVGFGSLVAFPHDAQMHHSHLVQQINEDPFRTRLETYFIAVASAMPISGLLHGFCVAPTTVAEEFRHLAVRMELLRHSQASDPNQEVILSALREELLTKRQELSAVRASTSWKITQPIRFFARLFAALRFFYD